MLRSNPHHILLIGDSRREFQMAIAQALPEAQITSVANVFDGIDELSSHSYAAILAAAEPIERRPEPAVRTLRKLANGSRLVLFGDPTLEILSRNMLKFGCDDYVITPPNPTELQSLLGAAPLRLATGASEQFPDKSQPDLESEPSATPALPELPFAGIFLDALLKAPHESVAWAVKTISEKLAPEMEIRYIRNGGAPGQPSDGQKLISQPVRSGKHELGTLCLLTNTNEDDASVAPILTQVADLIGKVALLEDRHARLQKLAISDELTGLYNARYFRHFLTRLIEHAKARRFPVTLLLFDIDDFKKYNDQYGHVVGDEILKQTAILMRRCCREHDLVARIGGDEFAVVFWDKEGPRQPHDGNKPTSHPRPPQTPIQMFERFKRLAAGSDFSGLGDSGRGRLSVSGGLAVYPYDANDVPSLIKAADDSLMFKAKRAGKNSVYLVEGRENGKLRE